MSNVLVQDHWSRTELARCRIRLLQEWSPRQAATPLAIATTFGLLTPADHNTPHEFNVHQKVARDSEPIITATIQSWNHHAHVAYLLTPEVAVGAGGFPHQPEFLHEFTV